MKNKRILLGLSLVIAFAVLFIWQFHKCSNYDISSNYDQNKLKQINIYIDWIPSGEYYGFFYAKEKGYYARSGFDVNIINGNGAPSVAAQLASGKSLIGTTTSDNILTQLMRGATFYKSVPIIKFNPNSIVSLQTAPVQQLDDIKGKRIGVNVQSSSYVQMENLIAVKNISKSSYKEIPIGYGGAVQLENDQVDAFLAYTTNQAVDLEMKGLKMKELNFGDVGINSYGLVLTVADWKYFVNTKITKYDIEKIIEESLNGYKAGAEDLDGVANALIKYDPTMNTDKLKAVVKKINSLNREKSIDIDQLDSWVKGDNITKQRNIDLYK